MKITSPSSVIKIYTVNAASPGDALKIWRDVLSYRLEKNLSLHYKPLLRSISLYWREEKHFFQFFEKTLEILQNVSHASILRQVARTTLQREIPEGRDSVSFLRCSAIGRDIDNHYHRGGGEERRGDSFPAKWNSWQSTNCGGRAGRLIIRPDSVRSKCQVGAIDPSANYEQRNGARNAEMDNLQPYFSNVAPLLNFLRLDTIPSIYLSSGVGRTILAEAPIVESK